MTKVQNNSNTLPESQNLDFKNLNLPNHKYTYKYDCFLMVPNFLIRHDIKETLNVNRILLMVYLFIYRRRTYEDVAFFTIRQLLDFCGYKTTRHKPKMFYEVVRCLLFLKWNNMVDVDFDPSDVSYDQVLEAMVIEENFIPASDFTRLYIADFDSIMEIECTVSKEIVLSVYLYICSFIGNYTHNMCSSVIQSDNDNPNSFWKSITAISKDLSLSKTTITQCLDILTTEHGNNKSLLVKRETGNIYIGESLQLQRTPNIYVLNKYGHEKEIELTIKKLQGT